MNSNREFIESPLLGKSAIPTEAEIADIGRFVRFMPVTVFQQLNQAFNTRGLCISIATKNEVN